MFRRLRTFTLVLTVQCDFVFIGMGVLNALLRLYIIIVKQRDDFFEFSECVICFLCVEFSSHEVKLYGGQSIFKDATLYLVRAAPQSARR